jgi:hypothetical protein
VMTRLVSDLETGGSGGSTVQPKIDAPRKIRGTRRMGARIMIGS